MPEPQPTAPAQGPSPRRPTLAPAGRLVRLGVVLDLGGQMERLREIARMCDRAGIGAVWVEEARATATANATALDAWTVLTLVAPAVTRANLGAMFLAGTRPADVLARMAATLGAVLGGRLEVGLRAADGDDLAAELALLARELAPVAAGTALPPRTVELPPAPAPGLLRELAAAADNVLLPQVDVEDAAALAGAVREAAGGGPAGPGIAARLPVSVGRTKAEARARWDATPAFGGLGDPERVAVFGTLEHCHETVIGLAHAGVTELRCLLPDAIDVHDVIAQLTAMAVGTVDKLSPGAPRSPSPAPPEGWGGRPRFPR
jgi:alkanesulfonate monooxygenase SsuD/methylene tetrahydromethanopterin reductase-like flavin-dependent oxidoreductase (luciferase family)